MHVMISVPLKKYALSNGLQVFDAPLSRQEFSKWSPEWLKKNTFDFGVVVSFGYFIPRGILELFSKGVVNVHPSLLPKYRGAAPIHHTILNGDKETGISIINLDPSRFDAGTILKQENVVIPNPETITFQELHDMLADKGGSNLVDTIRNFDSYQV
jgi:methionyl-tRNA formyltransferase